ncbi:MAG TPA: addiction module protein [Gemmataceae bacterium]|nr:addiction module protein [Gemmataceae bacterium]
MTDTLERLKAEAAALTGQQRAELAYFLIHSLDEQEEGVEEAWEAEIARRIEDIEAGRVVGIPAAQVFAELREKYS